MRLYYINKALGLGIRVLRVTCIVILNLVEVLVVSRVGGVRQHRVGNRRSLCCGPLLTYFND